MEYVIRNMEGKRENVKTEKAIMFGIKINIAWIETKKIGSNLTTTITISNKIFKVVPYYDGSYLIKEKK